MFIYSYKGRREGTSHFTDYVLLTLLVMVSLELKAELIVSKKETAKPTANIRVRSPSRTRKSTLKHYFDFSF